MRTIPIFLVKPHPPSEILDARCPVPEMYRYNWEPLSLKILAHALTTALGELVRPRVWHLMNRHDDDRFLQSVAHESPGIIAFSEIDILVGEINRLSQRIKSASPEIWTVVGGKQTSLLRAGDRFPFTHIDFAVRGDGATALKQLVQARLSGAASPDIAGAVKVNGAGLVAAPDAINPRMDICAIDGIGVRSVPVEHRPLSDYFTIHQSYPSIGTEEPRTASLLIGSGCPYACHICQSPVEYGESGSRVMLRRPDDVAQEIVWLRERYGATSFFSLESNLDLDNLRDLYRTLEAYDIHSLALSGFVRAADVVRAHRTGLLTHLTGKGLRVLSVGLDIPPGPEGDVYNKSFSYGEQMECLNICEDLGILVLATAIASPDVDRHILGEQLRILSELPVAEVDVRLAIALRNTPYFRAMETHLLHHPDRDTAYYDRQNYRYQTMHIPGGITPDETYDLVRRFHATFFTNKRHTDYVLRMARDHPDTLPFFQRQYGKRMPDTKSIPDEIKGAILAG